MVAREIKQQLYRRDAFLLRRKIAHSFALTSLLRFDYATFHERRFADATHYSVVKSVSIRLVRNGSACAL
jgi:hypothetical protein